MAARTDGATMLMIMIPGGPGRHGRPSRSPAIGIWLMVADGLGQGALLGNLAALVSAIGFSVLILSARWGRQADMLPMVVLGAVFSVAVSAFAGDPLAVPRMTVRCPSPRGRSCWILYRGSCLRRKPH